MLLEMLQGTATPLMGVCRRRRRNHLLRHRLLRRLDIRPRSPLRR